MDNLAPRLHRFCLLLLLVVLGASAALTTTGTPEIQQCPLSGNFTRDRPYLSKCRDPNGLNYNTTYLIFDQIKAFADKTGITDWRLNADGLPTMAGCASVVGRSAYRWTLYQFSEIWSRCVCSDQ